MSSGACNAPGLSAATGPAQSVAKHATVQLDGSASGARGDVSYLWRLDAVPPGSAAALSSTSIARPTFAADQPGVYVASLVVRDGCGSAAASAVITAANRPPVASGGPDLHAMPGDLVTLDGGGSSDPDQDALSFDWALVSRPPGSSAALSSASAAAPVFVPDRFGTYVALLTVSDGSASSAPVAVVVQVGVTGPAGNCAPAAAPVASPGPDQNVSFVSGVQLDGTRSTSGRAGPLTFRWSMTSAPAGSTASLSSATSPQAFFITDRVGVYVITLVVNDGCADSAPATVRVTRLNNPPSATVSVSSPVPILVPVALQSFVNDFDGDPITLRWQLVAAPAGSVASFVDATRADPGLTPDLEGSYTLSLVASDAVSSSAPAVVTFTAANLPPVAAGGPDQAGSVSVPVTLDGSSSLDPSRRPLGFSWTLQGPPGSAATLVGPTTPKPSFVPDLPGTYRAQLTVSAGGLSAQATASVAVWPAVTRLAYRVIDADYSTALDRLVVVAADPDALHLYDPRTGSDTAVGLPLTPATVSLSGDGLFAAVAHDGAVSYVDLAGATVVRTLPFVGDQAFAVLGDNAFVYTAQRGPAGDHIRLLAQPVAGGAITTAISSLTGAAHARVRNGAGALYLTSDSQFFFGGIEEYTLSGGTPAPVTPAGGVFTSACGNLWLSQAGTRLFTRCGVVLHASSSAVDDLTNAGTLAHAATSQLFLRHLSDSTAAGEISAIGSADTPFFITSDDQTLRRWDSNGLTQRESVPFPTETVGSGSFKWSGRFVFYRSDGSERYVVLQLDPAAAVVQDFGVVIF